MKKLIPALFLGLALAGLMMILNACDGSDSTTGPQTGSGGSMARFAITGNTLYIVTRQALDVYDISEGSNPRKTKQKQLGFGIETIFPYKDQLFVGANNGMYIFDNKFPDDPQQLSMFTHIQSCDPVVAQDNYAYVTLRSGTVCRFGNTISTLDVVDISNPSSPRQVYSTSMRSPYGLGVSGNRLFVCEGEYGLHVMDLTDPAKPVEKEFLQDLPAYDVIARPNHLIVTGSKGLFQYAFDDQDKFELLSTIPVL